MTKPATVTELHDKAEQMAGATPDVSLPKVDHDSLASALVASLSDLTVVDKGRTVDTGTYSYTYATLEDIVKRTRPVLSRHGVVALTPVHAHGDGLACTVTLVHEKGERFDFGPFPFPHGRDAQATGSMVTYHRRYALVAALGMAAGDDDDGAAAKPRQAQPPATVAKHPLRVECLALVQGDRLWSDFLGRAAIEDRDADAVLAEDEGWRNWLTQAIAAHKPKDETGAEGVGDGS